MAFGPNNGMGNANPQDLFASGQTWGCDSQSTPACWSGVCNHGSSGANQNCSALRMPSVSRGYSASQDAQLPPQSYKPVAATYDNSSFPAATEVQRAHDSKDVSWLPEIVNTNQADLMETPQPLSDVKEAQKSKKRAPAGELVRPKGRRLPHNLIERRYRDNLNHQIEVLRDELPTFKSIVACTSDIEDATALGGKWPSKAVVIAAAIQ
ncbi:hypothetical protein B0A55_08986 [Friedmanniomyces simplex]|uniref:BHLH domain-containing protein n=1 Tax=Friedmanniomyces simplex TaxID=329884 RepID=A0A4U0WVL1_9PEZI|nr:hypothetical protein B0A55_08986 [Friedmanniomyces simplex]